MSSPQPPSPIRHHRKISTTKFTYLITRVRSICRKTAIFVVSKRWRLSESEWCFVKVSLRWVRAKVMFRNPRFYSDLLMPWGVDWQSLNNFWSWRIFLFDFFLGGQGTTWRWKISGHMFKVGEKTLQRNWFQPPKYICWLRKVRTKVFRSLSCENIKNSNHRDSFFIWGTTKKSGKITPETTYVWSVALRVATVVECLC